MKNILLCALLLTLGASCGNKSSDVHPIGPPVCDSVFIDNASGVRTAIASVSQGTMTINLGKVSMDFFDLHQLIITYETSDAPDGAAAAEFILSSGQRMPIDDAVVKFEPLANGGYAWRSSSKLTKEMINGLQRLKIQGIILYGREIQVSEEFNSKFNFFAACIYSIR